MVEDLFDKSTDDKVVVRVHVHPGAGRTAVVGTHGDALKLKVAAPPADGRANEACADLLASTLGLKASQVTLESGDKSRTKRFAVTGIEAGEVARLLSEALAGAGADPSRRDLHRESRY